MTHRKQEGGRAPRGGAGVAATGFWGGFGTTALSLWLLPCVSFEEAELLRLRAETFLRNAERLYAEGEYDLAAFGVEQYCQLMLKYKLLLKTGAYPHTHSLIRLVR